MALESCSTLSIECDESGYFFLAKNKERGSRANSIKEVLEFWEWEGLERDDLDSPEVRLIPLQLLQFNQTENEE